MLAEMGKRPNIVFVFADQMRAQATGYAGNSDVQTPTLDSLATQSLIFTTAVAGCPVSTPWRATLLTGQYPLTHGLFLNDIQLDPHAVSLGKVLKQGGYNTGWIGKWHLDGPDRSSFVPPERRQGFDYWKAWNCTHSYNKSYYYDHDDPMPKLWDGYDAIAQTRDAQRYIEDHAGGDQPFALFLSWGPPHAPYLTAPQAYRDLYDPQSLTLRPNVPESQPKVAVNLAGYYAHVTALDDCVGELLKTIGECGIEDETAFLFTSDHGDMMGSRGQWKKQRPWDESILVPMLLRYPAMFGRPGRAVANPINSVDLMPTLLGLAGLDVPAPVEGADFTPFLRGEAEAPNGGAALIECPAPFGQWNRRQHGGREFRGLRTERYTYTRDLNGPWLLYDNEADPFQLDNRVDDPAMSELRGRMDEELQKKLDQRGDAFLSAEACIERFGYEINEDLTIDFENMV